MRATASSIRSCTKSFQGAERDQKVKVAFWLNSAEDLDRQDPRSGRTDLNAAEVEALARAARNR